MPHLVVGLHVIERGQRIVGGELPVRRAVEQGQIRAPSWVGSLSGATIGRPSGVRPVAQVSLCCMGRPTEEFSVGASEHVEEAVAVGLNHQLARLCTSHIASISDGGAMASKSCTSCGVNWKYHFSLPVFDTSATMESV